MSVSRRMGIKAVTFALALLLAEPMPGAVVRKDAKDKLRFAESKVLAWINGEELTYELYDDMSRLKELRYDYLSAHRVQEMKKDFFTELVERRLLVQEARRLGFEVSAEEMTERLRRYRAGRGAMDFRNLLGDIGLDYDRYCGLVYEDIIIEKLLSECLPGDYRVTGQEIDDYYFRHLGDYAQQDEVRALHIFLKSKREAKIALTSLRGGADFHKLARRKSQGREASSGGELGSFQRTEMPAVFFDSCWKLEVGEISGVVRSKHGYHIFKLLERKAGRMLLRSEVEGDIVERLRAGKREAAYAGFLCRLGEGAEIKLNEEVEFLSSLEDES